MGTDAVVVDEPCVNLMPSFHNRTLLYTVVDAVTK